MGICERGEYSLFPSPPPLGACCYLLDVVYVESRVESFVFSLSDYQRSHGLDLLCVPSDMEQRPADNRIHSPFASLDEDYYS